MAKKGGGAPDGYYDTGRRDSMGRPIYKKSQSRASGGGVSPPPSSQTPMDDHQAPTQELVVIEGEVIEGEIVDEEPDSEKEGSDDKSDTRAKGDKSGDSSEELTLGEEIKGILGEHDNVKSIRENKDGDHIVEFNSGSSLKISALAEEDEEGDELIITYRFYDDEGERIEETVGAKREDLNEALLMVADMDQDMDDGGAAAGMAMLPMMAAEGLLGNRMRRGRRRRGKSSSGGSQQRGLSAHLVQRFFSMIIPWREY